MRCTTCRQSNFAVLGSMEGLEAAVPQFTDQQAAIAIGSQLAEFSERVPAAERAAVADCLCWHNWPPTRPLNSPPT